ncbi:mechanosensitive ion channel, partial [Vibrio parahaemolyticus]|nr:mechanosensitive ion channel [Vibrio parahaemolyticus]
IILILGIVIVFTTIGIEWERLQRLVASIGVGLGFGLQEIFSNFISGLILLFDRTIRIGDKVTINELSGSVSKIQTL